MYVESWRIEHPRSYTAVGAVMLLAILVEWYEPFGTCLAATWSLYECLRQYSPIEWLEPVYVGVCYTISFVASWWYFKKPFT